MTKDVILKKKRGGGGAKSIVMLISIAMLIFLLFWAKILGGTSGVVKQLERGHSHVEESEGSVLYPLAHTHFRIIHKEHVIVCTSCSICQVNINVDMEF